MAVLKKASGLNTFGNEIFANQIDRVKLGDNTILMSPLENISLCYVIKGYSYLALQKLYKLRDAILQNQEVQSQLDSAITKSKLIRPLDAPQLDGLVKTIII